MVKPKLPQRPAEIPFQQVLDALLDTETPFPPRLLYRLSDLSRTDLAALAQSWPQAPTWRRQALLEDIETLGEADYLLDFESLAQFALQDPQAGVRLPAVRILSEYEDPPFATIFIELAKSDPDADVRAAAAAALGYYVYLGELEELDAAKKDQVEDFLLEIYRSNQPDLIRRRALESLGYTSREAVQPLIQQAYTAGNRDWTATALFAMGRSANEIWLPQVLESLDSLLPVIRAEAARAAGELEAHSTVPRLLELLDDPDEDVMTAAIWSLSQLGGEGVGNALVKVLKRTEDDELAEWIDSALENLAFTEGVQAFEMLELSDEDLEDEDDEFEDIDEDDIEDIDDDFLEGFADDRLDEFDEEDEEF